MINETIVILGDLSVDLHLSYKAHDAWDVVANRHAQAISPEVEQWHRDRNLRIMTYVSGKPVSITKHRVYQTWTHQVGFLFADKSAALLFKLTFGGDA